jgi:hypothetical protein
MTRQICFALSVLLLAAFSTPILAQTSNKIDEHVDARPISEMRKDMRSFVKQTKSSDPFVRQAAMMDLCVLHWEAATDPRYEGSQQLKSIRVSAKNRLQKFIEKTRKSAKETKVAPGLSNNNEPSSSDDSHSASAANQNRLIEQEIDSINSTSVDLMASLEGGPIKTSSYLGSNFAPMGDHSEDLIAVIESTINPDVWRNSGTGEASMYYYRPSLALVVTAPQEVQDRILILLHKLR